MSGFKVGSVVRLKSGGPKMTVKEVSDGRVWCIWFLDGDLKGDSFLPATVESDGGDDPEAFDFRD